jgi:hypothetical protein
MNRFNAYRFGFGPTAPVCRFSPAADSIIFRRFMHAECYKIGLFRVQFRNAGTTAQQKKTLSPKMSGGNVGRPGITADYFCHHYNL